MHALCCAGLEFQHHRCPFGFERLATANINGSVFPERMFEREFECRVGFSLRIFWNVFFFGISTVLSTNNVQLRLTESEGFKYTSFLVMDGLSCSLFGREHGEVSNDLQQMRLHHVSQNSHMIKIVRAAFYISLFQSTDLNIAHIFVAK